METTLRPLKGGELVAAKIGYTSRRVDFARARQVLWTDAQPDAGNLALCRVKSLGQLKRLELRDGRRAHLFPGNLVVLVYGNRYAPDYYEAVVPDDMGICHLAAAGGLAARVISKHERNSAPTQVEPLGLLADAEGNALNLSDFSLPPVPEQQGRPMVLAVMGTSMNSGKTTLAAALIRGLCAAGLKTGAAKVTGTGAGPDTWLMRDSGAEVVLDMLDAGLVSTYREPTRRIEEAAALLVNHLVHSGAEAIVLEIADGLFHTETQLLLGGDSPSPATTRNYLGQVMDGVLLAASDAMGARTGIDQLRHLGLPVLAMGGIVCRSPLAVREAMEYVGVPVLDIATLSSPGILPLVRELLLNQEKRKPAVLQAISTASGSH